MAEIVISIAAEVAGYLVAPIGRQLGYLFKYRSNVEDLKKQLDKLEEVKGRVEGDIDAATRIIGHEIEPVVEKWLKDVNGITEKVGKFLDDEGKAKKSCFNGLCPNLKSRYQLSKKAKNTTQEVIVKIQDGDKFDRVAYRAPPQGRGSTSIKGYETFESRMSTLKKVMEALKDPSINVIGVYGMGGVGKTMLVNEVSRIVEKDKLFDKVVMAVVSQPPDMEKIQGDIAKKLGLRFDEEIEPAGRANGLWERLKKEKSILVILDDIWAKLDLDAVGIPFGDKKCTILVTSRNQDTCNEMGAQKNFVVEVLSEKEAWDLFKKMAGDSVEATDLKSTAIEVAKECAGLPIAVAAVANALKNKDLPVWKNALHELKSSAPKNIPGMDAKVYSSLKLSYNYLESKEAKSLFLLCSLFPEDYNFSIQDFLKYGKGLGLFQGLDTLEKTRNRVHTLVHHLKASCLLLESNDTTRLGRMHDVVRDVGIDVASKDENMLIVRNSVELEDWTAEGKLRICRAISLPYSDIRELPTCLECPELKLLLLSSKYPSLKILDTFFEGMKQLKVLNLTNISFSSLHFLTNLQTLCLDQCVLRDITIIGELKKLEIISFQNSDINELPREIGQSTCLRMVEVKGCGRLKNLFSLSMARSLLHLEEIEITECKLMDAIVAEGREEAEDNNETMDKIVFPQLRYLKLEYLPKLMSFCSKVKLSTTDAGSEEIISEGEHDIPISLLGSEEIISEGEQDIPKPFLVSEEIISEGEHEIPISLLGSEEIISEVPLFNEKVSFPNLEDLVIQQVSSLKEIWHYQLPVGSFCKLKHLKVFWCDKLRNIFTTSIAKSLVQLQELSINRCEMVEEIVEKEGVEEEATDKIVFPQLRCLKLKWLPKLMSFCSKVKLSTTDAGCEEIISEGKDDIPIAFFNEKVSFPNLEDLLIQEVSSLKEIWHYQLPVGSFCKLKHLRVIGCGSLRNIFTTSIAKSLLQLQEISIMWCHMVEEIVQKEGVEEEATDKIVFPQLRSLTLFDLPKLMSFCSKVKLSTTDVGSKEIISEGEDDIPIAFFNEKVSFPNLEELLINSIPLKEIWHYQLPVGSFCKLKHLTVDSCDSLRNIFTTSITKSLVQLQELSIMWCDMVEEIVEKEGVEEEATDKIEFPQLRCLKLKWLPKLMSFCSKVKLSTTDAGSEEIISEGKDDIPIALFNEKVAFPILEELILESLPSMKEIWQGQFHALSFCKLRVLQVWGCDKLLKVLPISLLQNLQNLEELTVEFCSSLEEVFELGEVFGEVGHTATLPQLRELRLIELPKLVHLWKKDSQLFSKKSEVAFPILEELILESLPSMKEIWQGQFHALSFCKLRVLQVWGCDKLLKVLPISLLQNLQNLEELTVEFCSSLEEVFELGEVFGEVGHTATLPQLRELRLIELPKLVHLWKKDSQLFSKKSENAFPNLEELILGGLLDMKEIWQGQFHAQSFCKLRVLNIWQCNKILKVFPISLLQNLQNLEELSVVYCSSLEIISSEEGEATDEITFSQLTSLELRFLPNLTSFCQGSNTFSFPSLEKVLVEECPELKTFSNGILSTPKLEKVQVQEDEWIWKGNLNTTINHLFWEGGPITTIRHLFIE